MRTLRKKGKPSPQEAALKDAKPKLKPRAPILNMLARYFSVVNDPAQERALKAKEVRDGR